MSDHHDDKRCFQPEQETVEEFIERFKTQNFDRLSALKDTDIQKKAMLLAKYLPVNVLTDIQRRLKPVALSAATYDQIETQLVSLYSTKKSLIGASVSFLSRRQLSSETIVSYGSALNQLADQCNYKECCRDRMVRDVFICGLRSPKVMTSLVSECEGKTFNEVLEKAKVVEQIRQDIVDFNPTAGKTFSQNSVHKNQNSSYTYRQEQQDKTKNHRQSNMQKVNENYLCSRCGSRGKHHNSACWAKTAECKKCAKTGHIAKQCYTKNRQEDKYNNRSQKSRTNYKVSNSTENPEEIDPVQYFNMYAISPASPDDSPKKEKDAGRCNMVSTNQSAGDNGCSEVSTNQRPGDSGSRKTTTTNDGAVCKGNTLIPANKIAASISNSVHVGVANKFSGLYNSTETDLSCGSMYDLDIFDDAYEPFPINAVKQTCFRSRVIKQNNNSFLGRRVKSLSNLNP